MDLIPALVNQQGQTQQALSLLESGPHPALPMISQPPREQTAKMWVSRWKRTPLAEGSASSPKPLTNTILCTTIRARLYCLGAKYSRSTLHHDSSWVCLSQGHNKQRMSHSLSAFTHFPAALSLPDVTKWPTESSLSTPSRLGKSSQAWVSHKLNYSKENGSTLRPQCSGKCIRCMSLNTVRFLLYKRLEG